MIDYKDGHHSLVHLQLEPKLFLKSDKKRRAANGVRCGPDALVPPREADQEGRLGHFDHGSEGERD